MTPHEFGRRATHWCLRTEASTRSCALIRIGLALILWARFASELRPDFDADVRSIALSVSFFASTTLMLLGLLSRVATLAAAAVALSMYYWFGLALGREPWTHHHVYLLAFATLLCGLCPCGRSYSIDRWRALRRARQRGETPPLERGNVWALRLIALQLSTIYAFSALDKANWGFLSGDRIEHYLMWFHTGSHWPQSAPLHALAMTSAWATFLLECGLACLLFAPVRRWLVVPGLLLHGIFYLVLPVSTYTATMWCLYLAYFDPDAVHRALEHLEGGGRSPGDAKPAEEEDFHSGKSFPSESRSQSRRQG